VLRERNPREIRKADRFGAERRRGISEKEEITKNRKKRIDHTRETRFPFSEAGRGEGGQQRKKRFIERELTTECEEGVGKGKD